MKSALLCIAILIVSIVLVSGAKYECKPIYEGCVCQTKDLSCEDFDLMYNTLDEYIRSFRPSPIFLAQNPSLIFQVAKLVGGMVRLAFHDAVEHMPGTPQRSDGCINFQDSGNAGLQRIVDILDPLWKKFCSKISRADFWYLAAKVAMETSTPYTDYRNSLGVGNFKRFLKRQDPNYQIPNYNVPFYYGREDAVNCSYYGPSRLPSAQGQATEIQRVFIQNLGLTARETVALIGAHTLGSVVITESGYDGFWQSRADLFDIEFFQNLVNSTWLIQYMTDPAGKTVNQWTKAVNDGSGIDPGTVMLNTDIELLYDFDPNNVTNSLCGPYRENLASGTCQLTNQKYTNLNFPYHAFKFSEGDGCTNDQPGSGRWLSVFARAYHKMCSVGYERRHLTCAQCQTPNCVALGDNCTEEELCLGPQYGYYGPDPETENVNQSNDPNTSNNQNQPNQSDVPEIISEPATDSPSTESPSATDSPLIPDKPSISIGGGTGPAEIPSEPDGVISETTGNTTIDIPTLP